MRLKLHKALSKSLAIGTLVFVFWAATVFVGRNYESQDPESSAKLPASRDVIVGPDDRSSSTVTNSAIGLESDFIRLISIPGSDPVEVKFSLFPDYTIEVPDNLSIGYYELVERALGGDLDAAHSLFRNLRNCREISYKSEADLESAIVHLHQTHEFLSPSGVGFASISTVVSGVSDEVVDLVAEENWLRDLYRQCDGVPDEQLQEAEHWLRFASENGSLPALRELTAMLPPGQEKFDYFKMAWEQGDIIALYNMAFFHVEGWDGQNPNLIRAYAEYLVFIELLDSAGGGFQPWAAAAHAQINKSKLLLQENELNEAVRLAADILSDNRICCVSPHQ